MNLRYALLAAARRPIHAMRPCTPAIMRVLLSLALLASQQMATLHGISHWSGAAGSLSARQDDGGRPLKVLAHDASCAQCFAYAQLASAPGNSTFTYFAVHTVAVHLTSPATLADCARTVCAYHSRAPPQA